MTDVWRLATRRGLLLATVAFALTGRAARAMPAAAVAVSVADSVRHLMPGERWTLAVPLKNPSDTAMTFHVIVIPPAGWRVHNTAGSVTVAARQSDLAFISLSVGQTVPAGEGTLQYTVEHSGSPPYRAAVRYVVGERREVALTASAPTFVPAGRRYAAQFVVSNRGNTTRSYDVRFVSALPAALQGPASRRIVAGGTDTLVVVTSIPSACALGSSTVTVRLRPTVSSPGEHLSAFAQTSIVATSGGDAWVRLPVQLTPTMAGHEGGLAIEGRGALGDAHTQLDLVLRGPRRPTSIAGASDEYHLNLTSRSWALRLGDQAVRLTPLTEDGRVATGASASLTQSHWSAGAGSVITRQFGELTHLSEQFATLGVRLPGWIRLQGTALRRAGRADSGAVGGVQLAWSPSARHVVEVESDRAERGGSAWRARMSTRVSRLQLRGSVLAADSAFPGYARGTRSVDGDARLQLSRALWIRAGAEDRSTTDGLLFGRDVANPDTLLLHEPLARHRYRNAGFAIGLNRALQLEVRARRRDDPAGVLPWGVERSAALSSSFGSRRLRLSPRVEIGDVTSSLAEMPTPVQRASLDAQIGLGRFGSFSPSVGVESGRSMYDTTARRSWRAGAQLELHGAGVRATIGGQYGLTMVAGPWTPPAPSRRVDGSVVYELPGGDELLSRVRWDPQARALVGSDVRVEVGYTLRLGVPVGRPQGSGWVRGRLHYMEGGAGVRGAVVRLDGRLVMTDERGDFQISGVAAGPHTIDVDGRSLGAGRLVRDSAVRTIQVSAGRETKVALEIVTGGRIAGRVLWFDETAQPVLGEGVRPAAPPTRREEQLPAVRLVLSSGARSVEVLSDAAGRFGADGLEPGTWMVRAEPDALPMTHRLAPDGTRIIVPAGGTVTAELRIEPRPRTVHLLAPIEPPATHADSLTTRATRSTRATRATTVNGRRRDVPLQAVPRGKRPVVRDVPLMPEPMPHAVCPWPVVRPNGAICEEPPAPDTTIAPVKP